MSQRILDTISNPSDLKKLDFDEAARLAQEIREELIGVTSRTGGHLAPSLGAVELIIAIHRVIDSPHDHIIFDVGHQAYAHKVLTGRLKQFDTLRMYEGISGFPKREESPHDVHDSGHASDSLSIALGLAMARDLNGGDERIVVLIGDGSISSGLAFEAMNQIGQLYPKMTIVLNDNAMSISKNVGALSLSLAKARMNSKYLFASERLTQALSHRDTAFSRFLLRTGLNFKRAIKQFMVKGMLFEEMGIKYLGPINGHDISMVEAALCAAQEATGPVLIHAVTHKGEGYAPAKAHPDVFHGIGPFDKDTGIVYKRIGAPLSFTKVFSDALLQEASVNSSIVAITAAMPAGTGLDVFAKVYENRFFDVGIAEEHAITFASGLALGGKLPVVAIYSTFLQRGFDEMIINVALQNLHVVFCIDRAGLVGADGPTHHGVFDIAYLRLMPHMRILSPSNENELADALHTALLLDGPVALRYPRGNGMGIAVQETRTVWEEGKSVLRREGTDLAILALGRMVNNALEAAEILAKKGIEARVVDMRWAKPIDEEAILSVADYPLLVTIEEGTLFGGFGDAVFEVLAAKGLHPSIIPMGIPDEFICQGDTDTLFKVVGLDASAISARIIDALAQE